MSADEVKLHRLKRRVGNEKYIGVVARGTEEGDTDGVDRAKSSDDGTAEESDDENDPSN